MRSWCINPDGVGGIDIKFKEIMGSFSDGLVNNEGKREPEIYCTYGSILKITLEKLGQFRDL